VVGVPEEGGRNLISQDPLPPGSVYAACVDPEGKVGLYRVEVACTPGSGKLHVSGVPDRATRDSIQRAYAYLEGHVSQLGLERVLAGSDLHAQVIDLLSNGVGFDAGVAVFVALHSALRQAEVQPASVCIGDLTVQGTVRGVPALGDVLRICMDNGARRALLPLEARRALLEVEATVLEHVDAVFYGDPVAAAAKSVAAGT
jgi:ATP-dependent Lon protease